MYWIRTKKLKKQLRKGRITERQILPYLIAESICIQLTMMLIPFALMLAVEAEQTLFNIYDLASEIIVIAAFIIGIFYIFKKHQPASGSTFLQKYIPLSWVVAIQCLLGGMLIAIPIFINIGILSKDPDHLQGIVGLISAVVFHTVYYKLLGKHIAETN